ncbi:MAG: S-type pyocin family protein [Pseudomonadota bacterium]
MRVQGMTALAVAGLLALAGCDSGASAVETRDRAGTAEVALVAGEAPVGIEATAEAPKTVITANKRETVDAKAQRLFERNGAAFGARSAEDYLAKVQAFVANPPRDADRATRPNGDVLYYQASTNTFAVVSRDGVPRTMFKPDDGPAYWAKQKAAAPTFGQRRSRSNSEG